MEGVAFHCKEIPSYVVTTGSLPSPKAPHSLFLDSE